MYIQKVAEENGFITMREHGVSLVLNGITTLHRVIKVNTTEI